MAVSTSSQSEIFFADGLDKEFADLPVGQNQGDCEWSAPEGFAPNS
jgi:hypothetical protein